MALLTPLVFDAAEPAKIYLKGTSFTTPSADAEPAKIYLNGTSCTTPSAAFVPIARENVDLIRQNNELRARIALMTENVVLSQAKARLEEQLKTSGEAPGVVQGKAHTWKVASAKSKGVADRSSMKERPQQVDSKQLLRRSRDTWKANLGHSKAKAGVDITSDAASTDAGSGFTSEAEESVIDETGVNQSEIGRESQVPHAGLRASEPAGQVLTTAMMRNIPSEYTRADLLELIDQQGFNGLYDLVYMPIDFQTEVNHGFAVINLITVDDAEKFRAHFSGFSEWMIPSDRTCEVVWSDVMQGLDAHIERYRDSPIMHKSVEDRFKPILLKNGQRINFPEPTKVIKAPRTKKHREVTV